MKKTAIALSLLCALSGTVAFAQTDHFEDLVYNTPIGAFKRSEMPASVFLTSYCEQLTIDVVKESTNNFQTLTPEQRTQFDKRYQKAVPFVQTNQALVSANLSEEDWKKISMDFKLMLDSLRQRSTKKEITSFDQFHKECLEQAKKIAAPYDPKVKEAIAQKEAEAEKATAAGTTTATPPPPPSGNAAAPLAAAPAPTTPPTPAPPTPAPPAPVATTPPPPVTNDGAAEAIRKLTEGYQQPPTAAPAPAPAAPAR